jgi:hypothetical protein
MRPLRAAALVVLASAPVVPCAQTSGQSASDARAAPPRRARLTGLACQQSGEDVPTCGRRAGHSTTLFVGDPIETITVSSIDTGWCFVRSDSCDRATRAVQIAMR